MISENSSWLNDTNVQASEAVIKAPESLRGSFFKASLGIKNKLAWIKWSNILASFDKGGLGMGSLKSFNSSLLLKWRWLGALWVEVVKSIHGDEAGIDINGCQTNGLWASLVGTINHLHSSGIVPLSSIHFKASEAVIKVPESLCASFFRALSREARGLAIFR
ncbi:hypothetical protein Tco_1294154 [Tanacetum coccineum]